MKLPALTPLFLCPVLLAAPLESPQGPVVPTSSTRSEVVLNGTWRFALAEAKQKHPGNDWGTIQVPGSWFPQKGNVPGILERGKGDLWKKIDESTSAAWYERSLEIPANWAGREIEIAFERISTDAMVLLDDKEIGRIEWPGGTVNLTAAAKAGSRHTLRLYVVATPDAVDLEYMGIGQNTARKGTLQTKGITGDVVLSSRPRGTWIRGVFIQSSVREKNMKVTLEWGGKAPTQPVDCEIIATIWPGGEEAKRWKIELPAGAASSVVCEWENPKLWDYKQPNLYTLSVTTKADSISERFGFREWRIDGRTLLLNEIPFRPQPANLASGWMTPPGFGNHRATGTLLDLHMDRGIGIAWEWPEKFFQRGKPFYQKTLATVADEKGFPILGNLYRLNEFVNDANFDNIWPQNQTRWENLTTAEWRKYRNHPSIVGWLLSGNLGPHYADQNPRFIGKSKWHTSETTKLLAGVKAFMHGIDPGRSVLFGAASWPGDIYSAMTYLNFIPLQEREEWLSEWAKAGTMPYIAIEFGTPLMNSFMRGRNHFGPSGETEPWLSEMAAIYLGPDAYKESLEYRRKIRGNYLGGSKFKSFNFENAVTGDPIFQEVQELFIRNTWRSWRSLDAGWAGMLSWADDYNFPATKTTELVDLHAEFKPGLRGAFPPGVVASSLTTSYRDGGFHQIRPGGAQLLANGQPTLAWIAGPPEAYTAKDHNFRAGQTIRKQASLTNDTRGPLDYDAHWTIHAGGTQVAQGNLKGTISPGTSLLLPLEATLSGREIASIEEGQIELVAKIGTTEHKDHFPFRIFPPEPQSSPIATTVLVADSLGKTSAWLASLGVKTKPWDGEPAPGALLVVGRQTLSGTAGKGPQLKALEEFTTAGGRLLIMPQDAEWTRQNTGFRVTRHSTRRMWPIQSKHPLMAGLSVDALRDWAGSSTIQEAKPVYPGHEFPPYGWRWGQRGVLGATVIEKPHFTGWRPIFESEFDLQYTPLMELDIGKGRVTWCALDLEDQSAADPAAERIGRNLIEYVADAPLTARATKTIYVGGDAGANFLNSIGLVFKRETAPDSTSQLIIVAPDAALSAEALWSHVERGAHVFILGSTKATDGHFGAKIAIAKDFRGSTDPTLSAKFSGLGAGDLRLKTDLDWPIITASSLPGLQIQANGMLALRKHGRGVAVWAQLGPELLHSTHQEFPEYLRFTRWRQCRAICQILANLGATFEADSRVFRPVVERISLAGPWHVQLTSELPLVDWSHKHTDPGISSKARSLTDPASPPNEGDWSTYQLPGWYPQFDKTCGEAVWKREIEIPAEWAGKFVQINIPAIKSYDTVFWNGQAVDFTSKDTQKEDPWNLPRKYRVPGEWVRSGTNILVIRQFVPDQKGGIHGHAAGFHLSVLSGEKPAAPLYHSDYREEFETGDEPYRYIRW